jgi:AraC family transcriptional activator of pobA
MEGRGGGGTRLITTFNMDHYKTLHQLHAGYGFTPPEHPLISLIWCGGCNVRNFTYTSDYYMIGFKKMKAGVMLYGQTKYDHHNGGSMFFVKPDQMIGVRDLELEEFGFMIHFHEDLLLGHSLHAEIKKYSFFDYEVNEALHLSAREEGVIVDIFRQMETEYCNNQDEFSREILIAHLDAILKYSLRFYRRQFIDRKDLSGKTISRFTGLLRAYFDKGLMREKGLPSVSYLAGELHLSPRYLSDLLKQETGKTALELVHVHLISEAKSLLANQEYSISEVAYLLGFGNPPYFSRLFKKETGRSPVEFRKHAYS